MTNDVRGIWQANLRASASALTPRFWLLAALTGVASGIGAIVMMALLRAVQHAAFDYHTGEYSAAAAAHGDLRRMLVLVGGGVVAGIGGWVIHTRLGGSGGSPTEAVWSGRDDLSLPRTLLNGGLSEVVIGLGASLGREAAPQHAGAAFGAWIGRHFSLPREQKMLLIACGAGRRRGRRLQRAARRRAVRGRAVHGLDHAGHGRAGAPDRVDRHRDRLDRTAGHRRSTTCRSCPPRARRSSAGRCWPGR